MIPTDRITCEFLNKDVIKWVPPFDRRCSWMGTENYILNDWVVDAFENNEKVRKYFKEILAIDKIIS